MLTSVSQRQVLSNVAEVTSMSLISQRSRGPCTNGSWKQLWLLQSKCVGQQWMPCKLQSMFYSWLEITCSSRNYKTAVCNTGHQIRAVSIKRHISNSPCVEGFSYRTIGSQLQVLNGCRATFTVGYRD
ncbi:hypothetical protein PoB_005267200 [Plakobranchus ocellatus]|uniref:Uncharacterized protein n=1 Tax=Plakobranchus ocellatus TaxID=259542 RepID=A0AAV4C489_9GAST|nr:hypothetical protein PoB_005267200 [Plakobranchus ocellatus]